MAPAILGGMCPFYHILISRTGSTGRCNTIWYKSFFKKVVFMNHARRWKAGQRKLQEIVASKLMQDWSPEQISGCLKRQYPNDEGPISGGQSFFLLPGPRE